MADNQKPQQFMQFLADLVGALAPLDVARTTVTYARDLIGCERCSLLAYQHNRWRVLAISGQDTIEQRSVAVKMLTSFVAAKANKSTELLHRDDPTSLDTPEDERKRNDVMLAPTASSAPEVAGYFKNSRMASAAIVPLLNVQKELIGALFCESVLDKFFSSPQRGVPAAGQRVAEWIARHSSRALVAAEDYNTLPLLGPMRRARALYQGWTGRHRHRKMAKLAILISISAFILLWPATLKIEGNCTLRPSDHTTIVPQIAGQLDKVFVSEGDKVKKGQILATLDSRKLQSDLEIVLQDKLRYQSEVERYRASGDEASSQIAAIQKKIAEQKEKRLREEIDAASLKSPIDGIVLTKDLNLRVGDYIQPGAQLIEVASLKQWELLVDVRESDIGLIDSALKTRPPVPIHFILYTRSSQTLQGDITDRKQISAVANRESNEANFTITIPHPRIPDEMQSSLRPGLTGRAKIELAKRPFCFVLTRKFFHWLRMRWIV